MIYCCNAILRVVFLIPLPSNCSCWSAGRLSRIWSSVCSLHMLTLVIKNSSGEATHHLFLLTFILMSPSCNLALLAVIKCIQWTGQTHRQNGVWKISTMSWCLLLQSHQSWGRWKTAGYWTGLWDEETANVRWPSPNRHLWCNTYSTVLNSMVPS